MSATTIQPLRAIWLIPAEQLFDPVQFLGRSVSPAKREAMPEPRQMVDAFGVEPYPFTREMELRARNARNLLRWIARRDARKQPFGFVVRP